MDTKRVSAPQSLVRYDQASLVCQVFVVVFGSGTQGQSCFLPLNDYRNSLGISLKHYTYPFVILCMYSVLLTFFQLIFKVKLNMRTTDFFIPLQNQ